MITITVAVYHNVYSGLGLTTLLKVMIIQVFSNYFNLFYDFCILYSYFYGLRIRKSEIPSYFVNKERILGRRIIDTIKVEKKKISETRVNMDFLIFEVLDRNHRWEQTYY